MKKIIASVAMFLICNVVVSQITLNTVFTSTASNFNFYVTKFGNAGQKIVLTSGNVIQIYNLNNTLFKTVTIPASVTPAGFYVCYVSDVLFDLNPDIEYIVVNFGSGSSPMSVYVMDETGAQMLKCDSANLGQAHLKDPFMGQDAIFQTASGAKMRVLKYSNGSGPFTTKAELYDLPGTLPCYVCASTGTVTGLIGNEEADGNDPVFYPNPAQEQLRLKYELPEGSHSATIRVHDVSGKLVEEMQVTSSFNHILMPSSYNSGLYFYSLYVDGRLIKSEKIVLSK